MLEEILVMGTMQQEEVDKLSNIYNMKIDNLKVSKLNNLELETIRGGSRLSYAIGWVCGKLQNLAEKLDTNTQWLA